MTESVSVFFERDQSHQESLRIAEESRTGNLRSRLVN